MNWFAGQLFDGSRWWRNQSLQLLNGRATSSPFHVSCSTSEGRATEVASVVIPGMINAHSHAFQAGFAGMCENRVDGPDDFWEWRRRMYAFLADLDPDTMYDVARRAYLRMLHLGYTAVGEFHYVHHDPHGTPYAEPTIMADSVIRAARDVGMRIRLLLSLYQRGGFDDRALEGPPRRFQHSLDTFLASLDGLRQRWRHDPGVTLGIAPHSLRAVRPEVIAELVETASHEDPYMPIHIHLAEQVQEVDDCLARTGRRPLELLLDHVDLGPRWNLIHATHLSTGEMNAVVQSGATVVLCPSTEANLGDGIFPARDFLDQGGSLAIGSDSQVTLDPFSELRLLEYGQRLVSRRRAVLASHAESTGRRLYATALRGGERAIGRTSARGQESMPDGWLQIDPRHPGVAKRKEDEILDGLIFHEAGPAVMKTIVGAARIGGEDEQTSNPAEELP